ncbi:MAG TPA: hypothetical protein VGR37_00895, partial [Longimicrobiaceae bacterium]|nr:hypothetical protein [Longimicrobiaceae bacterium]
MRTRHLSPSAPPRLPGAGAALASAAGGDYAQAARWPRRLRDLLRAGPSPQPRSAPRFLLPLGAAALALLPLMLPERAGPALGALWLLALVPAFLLAYHGGWRGGAVAAGAVAGCTLALAAFG